VATVTLAAHRRLLDDPVDDLPIDASVMALIETVRSKVRASLVHPGTAATPCAPFDHLQLWRSHQGAAAGGFWMYYIEFLDAAAEEIIDPYGLDVWSAEQAVEATQHVFDVAPSEWQWIERRQV